MLYPSPAGIGELASGVLVRPNLGEIIVILVRDQCLLLPAFCFCRLITVEFRGVTIQSGHNLI